jgi:hypothetical protein
LLGLGGAVVAGAIVFIVFHWSLPWWLSLIGFAIFIVCSTRSEWIISFTKFEQAEHDAAVLAQGAHLLTLGFWRYAVPEIVAFLVLFAIGVPLYVWLVRHGSAPLGDDLRLLGYWLLICVGLCAALTLAMAVCYWWYRRRANRLALRLQAERDVSQS